MQAPPMPPPEPVSDVPVAAPSLAPDELPQPLPIHKSPPPDRPVRRALLTTAAGVGGAAVALGLSLAISTCFFSCQPKFDVNFANAALGAMLVTGAGFAVHQLTGGGGEVILPLLAATALMFAASFVGPVIDSRTPQQEVFTTVIGALPAAVAVALILDATSSIDRSRVRW
jgi:hypothetical protein